MTRLKVATFNCEWRRTGSSDGCLIREKKLTERRDTADVTELLKELHRIVNEAILTQAPGDDQAEGLTFDLSTIDMEKLRAEFAKPDANGLSSRLAELDRFWEKEQTKAEVEVFILDQVFASLPTRPFSPNEKKAVAARVYAHVWQQALRGDYAQAA